MAENRISELLLKAAFNVHKNVGPGLMTGSYIPCLAYEIRKSGLTVECHKKMPLVYGDLKVNVGYAVDLLVEKRVLVNIKNCEKFSDLDMAKMQTYLKLSGCKMGYLINFNVPTLKTGIRRVLFSHIYKSDAVRTAS
ncbi:MAG: GxxExxY protein [Saprospiraceae bacterium]|nr:GxxExxY protein [Saprospiraceae bacterium]